METIRFMRDNKDKAIAIAAEKTGVSKAVATEGYNDTMPIFSTDRAFRAEGAGRAGDLVRRHQAAAGEARHDEAADGSVSAEMTGCTRLPRPGKPIPHLADERMTGCHRRSPGMTVA